jgi:hypothetical protein
MKKIYFLFFSVAFTAKVFAQTATIPVVFHVVWRTTVQNIPDSCLQQQLDVLNEDYNAANPDIWKVPSAWVPIIGNMNVNFVLASTDPNGNPTTGIERRQTTVPSFSTTGSVCYYAQGGLDAWPDTSYLNIWICNIGNGLLGYAQFPGGNPATDGVVLHYRNTGRGTYCWTPYDHGRTGTHEVAHWFGLRNFVDQSNCSIDGDLIPDTPTYTNSSIYGSYAPFQVITDVCNPSAPGIMWMNFMTQVDDTSMYFFTQNQIDTMTWVMNNLRAGIVSTGIKNLSEKNELSIFPSPSADGIFTLRRTEENIPATVFVYNVTGEVVSQISVNGKTAKLDLSALPDGYYTVLISQGGKQEARKIVIAR